MSGKPTVMVLGANLYTEPSIASLKDYGYRLVIVDGNTNAPGFAHAEVRGIFSFREVEKCIALAKKENVKAVIPTHDMAVVPAATISSELGLIGSSLESAEIATNKRKMREVWNRAGLPSPGFQLADSMESFISAVKKTGFPAICKPTGDVGGGGRGIMKLDETTDLEKSFAFASSFMDVVEILIEPFFEGREHSVEILMKDGKGTVLMVSDKIQTSPPFRVGKSLIFPADQKGETLEKIKGFSIEATLAVGLKNGAAHVELVSMGNGRVILFEIGLRCGGGVIPHPVATVVTGINQFVEYARILLGESDGNFQPKQMHPACWHFITAKSGKLKEIRGFSEASSMDGIVSSGLAVESGDMIETLKTSSQRLGYFVTVGKTNKEAYERALKAEKKLEFVFET